MPVDLTSTAMAGATNCSIARLSYVLPFHPPAALRTLSIQHSSCFGPCRSRKTTWHGQSVPPTARRTFRKHMVFACASSGQIDHKEGGTSAKSEDPLRLELDHVKKVFGDRVVVDDVSIYVQQDEVVGLLGPNGAGKSTTFGIMVGRDWPTEGAVRLGNEDITSLALEKRARLGIGYMAQEPSIFRGLTVHDNILLVLEETGVPRAQRQPRLEELLELFRLRHVADTMGRALSGGERRRTELARALATTCSGGPPSILLVDEPFAGVDPIGVSEIQTLLRHLCKVNHMGILITDHNVTETLKICDRAYMVYQGRVMASGSPEELYNNKYVRQYYLGDGYLNPLSRLGG